MKLWTKELLNIKDIYNLHNQLKGSNRLHGVNAVQILLLCLILNMPCNVSAQLMDNSHRVDTLPVKERISIRTNLTDLLLQIPNVGAEFDIRRENWNRWSVGANVRWRPNTRHSFVQPLQLNVFEMSLEGKQYWRERQATSKGYLKPHVRNIDKLFSCRNKFPSHSKWIFYRGGYVSYSDYSLLLNNHFGRQGSAVMAGVTWGFVTPWIGFVNGNSLDLEMGVSFGACYTRYTEYGYNAEDNCYPKGDFNDWHILPYPVIKDLHVAVVYRMGKYPLSKKYRWRYDADIEYRNYVDSLYLDSESRALNRQINDSVYKEVWRDFQHTYDSICGANLREEEDNLIKVNVKSISEFDRKKKDKEKEEAERDSLRLIEKSTRVKHKESRKSVDAGKTSEQVPVEPSQQNEETTEATERKEVTDEKTE